MHFSSSGVTVSWWGLIQTIAPKLFGSFWTNFKTVRKPWSWLTWWIPYLVTEGYSAQSQSETRVKPIKVLFIGLDQEIFALFDCGPMGNVGVGINNHGFSLVLF
jgi:hypothetical protein